MKRKRFWIAFFLLWLISLSAFSACAQDAGVETKEEASKYLLSEIKEGKMEIRMEVMPALYEALSEAENLFDVFSNAKIATAESRLEDGALCLYNITAYPDCVYCESMSDAVSAFDGKSDDVVLNLSKAFYDEFTANDFALYFELDKMAGITSRDCVYYAQTRIFIYENIEYKDDIVHIETVDELKRYISQCAENMDKEIVYSLSDGMYEMVKFNQSIECELYAVYGIYSYSNYMVDESRMRMIKDIVYYPGARIMHAVRNHSMDMLTDEELHLYNTALSISQNAMEKYSGKADGGILIEKMLVQEIASRCEYFISEEDVFNTSVGALLYGKADCDGYADALYLLGNLSGITVYHQLGYTADGGSHMWNLVYAGGRWHFTDPIGCDMNLDERRDAINVNWFAMGIESALSRYIWMPISQIAQVDPDDERILDAVMDGRVFDSIDKARAYLEINTDVWTQFVVKNIRKEEAEEAAKNIVYGYGGPYVQVHEGDRLCVTLLSTWFDRENFYDCYTQEDVIHALSSEHAEIILRLNGEVFGTYRKDGGSELSQMEKAAGIQSSQKSFYESTRVFLYNDIVRK